MNKLSGNFLTYSKQTTATIKMPVEGTSFYTELQLLEMETNNSCLRVPCTAEVNLAAIQDAVYGWREFQSIFLSS